MTLLAVERLCVAYPGEGGPVHALRGVDLRVDRGEIVGVVGESGCGKSTLASALLGLLPPGATAEGRVVLDGHDLLALPERGRRRLRGPTVSLVSQDPMGALSPVLTVAEQLCDFQHNLRLSRRDRHDRAREALGSVGLPDALLARFPHELSGGQRQRVAIAAALLNRPALLVADEPTTALDVTTEAQVLDLLGRLRGDAGTAVVLVTHHLGVVGALCDRVVVLYAGEIVEEGRVEEVHDDPRHPYTRALLACDPGALAARARRLPTIPGRPPGLAAPPPGCSFAPRCPRALGRCLTPPPRVRLSPSHAALCHRALA